jgi:quinol monooxygenase YgiN
MSEIVVVGSFTAQAGKEADALEAFKALVEPTHGEEGCILYALIVVYEAVPGGETKKGSLAAHAAG